MEFDYSTALTHAMGHVMKLHKKNVEYLIQNYDVYPGQPILLMRLAKTDGLMQKELARRIQVKPATLTVMINRMEKCGLVERRADERDQRISRVFLTDKGRLATKAVKEALRILELKCFECFTDEEKIVLQGMLERMHNNLQTFYLENTEPSAEPNE
ncbi:MarR family transcriptional regulator [Brevibacillus agri]|uniref:MarR family transcriptional regulator n=1 Tax=Brevibacillus agri TaxID=51101 RepID=A0A3M8BAF3_9BACL|nr:MULTISPECIES: MarR family transcriptional regulator [Brevibacillus]ELK39569.1 transcriptional regulator [Brevibacillus agri BAB-2500]EJL39440.1 transcriptional regulator [Brevibacillus sp. CF112]MBG9565796.1 MarR family transcriptional regulator [Brevibacillus agri]MBY0053819.1 MarR family transcriptional regulator [Brevibacillus agri]MCG5250823.1 MarR family transcriptional regulator [Brevibacillus agri]